MQASLFVDTLTVTGGGTYPARIEPRRIPTGYRGALHDPGEARGSHTAYLPPSVYNADGSVQAAVVVPFEAHCTDQTGTEYLLMGAVQGPKLRSGAVDHLEAMLQVLAADPVTINRQATSVDSEGNAVGAWTLIGTTKGTWGAPNAHEEQLAAQRGEQVDAVLTVVTTNVLIGDQVVVMGSTWYVTSLVRHRVHTRLMLRRAGQQATGG